MPKKENRDKLQKIADKCNTKIDFALKLGYSYYNGKISRVLQNLILKYNLNIDHFDSSYKNKARTKYHTIIKKCPICDKEFETKLGHKKEKSTCSVSCSNTYHYNLRYNDNINVKRSKTLSKKLKTLSKFLSIIKCKTCNKKFKVKKKSQICCSRSCSSKNNWSDPKYRKIIIDKINERVNSGKHKGWASRSKVERSFPEKYTIKILDSFNVKYKSEFKVAKWFIDFADVDRKIAFEVDGKQHELPERKESDQKKDIYLKKHGWVVYRYKWKKIKTLDDRKNYIKIIKKVFKIK